MIIPKMLINTVTNQMVKHFKLDKIIFLYKPNISLFVKISTTNLLKKGLQKYFNIVLGKKKFE